MMRKLCLALLALTAASPVAGEVVGYRGPWRLERVANGCSMTFKAEQGGSVLVGLPSNAPDKAMIVFTDPAWQSLVVGQTYPLQVKLGNTSMPVTASALVYEGDKGIRFLMDRKTLLSATASALSVIRDGAVITGYHFHHDDDAFYALVSCAGQDTDPFAK